KTGKNNNGISVNQVEQTIRKPPHESSSDLSVHARKCQGVTLNRNEAGVNGEKKLSPQTGASFFIPSKRVGEVGFGFGPKDNFESHPRFRILFLTSAHGEPAAGFLRKA